MIDEEVLLREKRKYNLEPTISNHERKLLKKDYPVQKIIGFQIFQDVYLNIHNNVLIPRYETEEVILECYKHINKDSNVLDLGCGCGFIGLAIKKNVGCNVTMVDVSTAAIAQTKVNAKKNHLEDVSIIKSTWFSNVSGTFDLIVSNPPYLDDKKPYPKSLSYEPKKALFASEEGFGAYREILNEAKMYLKENGLLIFEIDPVNAAKLLEIYPKTLIKKDINGKERIAILKQKDL